MKSKFTAHYSLLLVVLVHAGVLAAVLFAPESPEPPVVIPPTIQGVIVSVEPVEPPPEPVPPPPPPPEQKPLPKPKKPLPKAPPSERAVQEEVAVEPTPPAPVEQKSEPQPQAPVVPPRADATQINNPAPVYPTISKRLREEGTVILEILVTASGSVAEMRLKQSSGYERLDEAAMRAVKQWHFLPARRGNEAIDFWYELPIEFSLNK
ncbi:MAG TPA: energy transducer TonB [Cellvibrio sp.]|nr:energy transducer TonB [Cellvibrio sp.]